MKQFILILSFLACINIAYGQTVTEIKNENDTNKIFTRVEVEAAFPGGDTAWRNFLRKNLNAGELIDNGAKRGTYKVIVKFIVSKDGSLSDIHCENDPGYGSCKEVLRVMKKNPNWVPALVNGNKVNSYRTQPFTFVVE